MADYQIKDLTTNASPALTDVMAEDNASNVTYKSTKQKLFDLIASLTAKTTLAEADIIPLTDSAASNAAKGITWTNLRSQVDSFTTTVTAAGTTTLTASSTRIQEFTGTTTQTVVMPVVSTLVLGRTFIVINNSTGIITVNSSGGNLIASIAAGEVWRLVCVLVTGTAAASWDAAGGNNTNSGEYTPTFTNTTNIAASTPASTHYMRIGNTVFVSGLCLVDPTSTGATELGVSLPIASNLADLKDCVGNVTSNDASSPESGWVVADTTNKRAKVQWVTVNIGNHYVAFSFMYKII